MKKTFIVVLAFLIAVSSAFAGGRQQDSGGKRPVTLHWSWWGSDVRHTATIAAIELYQKQNPHVTIEYEYMGFDTYYQKLLTQLAGGTAPEISQVDYKWIGDLVAQGNPFYNINEMKDKIDLSKFDRNFLDNFCGTGGYLIGVPCGINGRGVLYNTEFFAKYGLTAGKNWTWADVLAAGRKVTGQNKDAHLLFMTNDVLIYITRDWIKQKYGQNMITDDYRLIAAEADMIEIMQLVRDLVDTGTMPSYEETVPYETIFADQIPAWLDDRWGMTVYSASNLPAIVAASKFKVGTMPWVSGNGKYSAITIAPTMMMCIPKTAKNVDEAAAFINWFVNNPEAVMITKDTRGVPVNSEAVSTLQGAGFIQSQVSDMLADALVQGGTPENALSLNAEIGAVISDYTHKVGYKMLSPADGGRQLFADINRLLAQLKK